MECVLWDYPLFLTSILLLLKTNFSQAEDKIDGKKVDKIFTVNYNNHRPRYKNNIKPTIWLKEYCFHQKDDYNLKLRDTTNDKLQGVGVDNSISER